MGNIVNNLRAYLVCIILLAASGQICAQRGSSGDKVFNLGVKGGVNFPSGTNLFSAETYKSINLIGFHIGPILDVRIPLGGLGLDLALLYSMKGNITATGIGSDNSNQEYRHSLYIPLNVKYTFNLIKVFGLYISAGPYIDYTFGDMSNMTIGQIGDKIVADYKSYNFDWGVGVGGGIVLFRHLNIGVNYNFGLNDVQSYKDIEGIKNIKCNVLMVSASYTF